jgi:ComF family protein
MWFSRALRWIANLVFPPACPLCKTILGRNDKDLIVCPSCQKEVRLVRPPVCPHCGLPVPAEDGAGYLCGPCLQERRYFEIHRTSGLYEGALKEAIHRFKYEGVFPLVRFFGDLLQPTLRTLSQDYPMDVMVPVPLHIRRLRERGFNQVLLLVKELNKRFGIPYGERILKKVKDTPLQSALKKKERRKNLRGAFEVQDQAAIAGKAIVLVDDVYTTGATVNECSRALLKAGAARVAVLTVARAL